MFLLKYTALDHIHISKMCFGHSLVFLFLWLFICDDQKHSHIFWKRQTISIKYMISTDFKNINVLLLSIVIFRWLYIFNQ